MAISHLHKSLHFEGNEILKVDIDAKANVYLLEHPNYHLFMQNMDYEFHGKEVESSPFFMKPPHPGYWELVIFSAEPSTALSAQVSIVEE